MIERILALSPHTDDCELGCGGSLARFIREGKQIFYVAFSSAEKSVPPEMPKDILKQEVKKATKALGIERENLILLDYEVRSFQAFRQEILEEMIRLENELEPDLVFLPSSHDTHQDHQVISNEGFRAFKKTSMLGYELPWNNLTFETNCFVWLDECDLRKKVQALRCYISQLGRDYVSEDFARSLARTRGGQIGVRYAEAFEIFHWVWR